VAFPWRNAPGNQPKEGITMSIKKLVMASTALATLALASVAMADDHAYTEGPVVNVSYIRTEYGKFDDYLNYLDTTWKQTQEAAKKAGYILSYSVLLAEPRNESEPDIILTITYKNWAALDDATAKGDAIAKQVEGSVAASNKAATDRGKIRRVIGSQTLQELHLK
jgi:hypothetical protein